MWIMFAIGWIGGIVMVSQHGLIAKVLITVIVFGLATLVEKWLKNNS